MYRPPLKTTGLINTARTQFFPFKKFDSPFRTFITFDKIVKDEDGQSRVLFMNSKFSKLPDQSNKDYQIQEKHRLREILTKHFGDQRKLLLLKVNHTVLKPRKTRSGENALQVVDSGHLAAAITNPLLNIEAVMSKIPGVNSNPELFDKAPHIRVEGVGLLASQGYEMEAHFETVEEYLEESLITDDPTAQNKGAPEQFVAVDLEIVDMGTDTELNPDEKAALFAKRVQEIMAMRPIYDPMKSACGQAVTEGILGKIFENTSPQTAATKILQEGISKEDLTLTTNIDKAIQDSGLNVKGHEHGKRLLEQEAEKAKTQVTPPPVNKI